MIRQSDLLKTIEIVILVCGLFGLAALKGYQFFYHPEWSESEALWNLWPYYLGVISTVVVSYIPGYLMGKKTES